MPRMVSDYAGEEVRPKKRLRLSEYAIPSDIRLEGSDLFWQPITEWRRVKPTIETFTRFVELCDASDQQIFRYARQWGVLWLCKEHKEPTSDVNHWKCVPLNPEPAESPADYPPEHLHIWQEHFASEGESVEEYRRWSRIARAILRIGVKLSEAKLADREDWQVLWDDRWFDKKYGWTQDKSFKYEIDIEKGYMSRAINRWMQIADVRPHLAWGDFNATLSLAGAGLLGAIALGLLENHGRASAIAACTGCRRFYLPTIKPKSGQDRYCQTCRDAGVPVAMAKHRQTLKRQMARKK